MPAFACSKLVLCWCDHLVLYTLLVETNWFEWCLYIYTSWTYLTTDKYHITNLPICSVLLLKLVCNLPSCTCCLSIYCSLVSLAQPSPDHLSLSSLQFPPSPPLISSTIIPSLSLPSFLWLICKSSTHYPDYQDDSRLPIWRLLRAHGGGSVGPTTKELKSMEHGGPHPRIDFNVLIQE